MKRLLLALTILFAFALGGVAQQVSFDFEDGTLQGWTTLDGDGDGHCWEPSIGGMGHNSNGMVMAYSKDYATGDSLTPNEYLVSPRLVLSEDWPVIHFYACALDETYPAEHFGVSISTTVNDDPLAFTLLSEWTIAAKDAENRQGNWYNYTVDLSAYTGQEVYVAIRHHYCSGQSAVCIDDIEISGTIPEPLPFAPLGAEWYFNVSSAWGYSVTYHHTYVMCQEYVQGQLCSNIAFPYYGAYGGNEMVYEENGVVYWYNGATDNFTVLYDFNADEGDSWICEIESHSYQIVVQSVSDVTYNGHVYRRQEVVSPDGLFDGYPYYGHNYIIEGIGYVTGVFPYAYYYFGDIYPNYLRCYIVDDEILYHEGSHDCDYVSGTGSSGPEWYYEIQNENGSITYQYMYQAGDTIVNDEPTHILVKINTLYDKDVHTDVTHEYVYERDGKLYWWNKTLEEFTVLYDLDAQEGDSWVIKVGTETLTMHVDAVENIEYEGRTYRMLRVSDPDNLFSGDIVCGIGHLTSFFPERLMDNGDGVRVEGLRCYWVEDELVFKYGDEDCDAIYDELHRVEEDVENQFNVYPNPTNGVLFVETHGRASLPTPTYRISNLMGQTILSGNITAENQQIDVTGLPEGMYFITVGDATRKFVVR